MRELITPAQSEQLVVIVALATALIGAVWGYRALGRRGVAAGLCGPLIFALWQFHKYVTRYDPATGYLGLNKVKVLLLEVVLFIGIGAALGWVWSEINKKTNHE